MKEEIKIIIKATCCFHRDVENAICSDCGKFIDNVLECFEDGNQICCVTKEGFTNIQECAAGFGLTTKEAISDLKRQIKKDDMLTPCVPK